MLHVGKWITCAVLFFITKGKEWQFLATYLIVLILSLLCRLTDVPKLGIKEMGQTSLLIRAPFPLQCLRLLPYAPGTRWHQWAGRSPSSVRPLVTHSLLSSGRGRAVRWDWPSACHQTKSPLCGNKANEGVSNSVISVSPPESLVLLPAATALQPSVCLPDGQFDHYWCSALWWWLLQLPGSQHRWQCYYQSTAGGYRLWVKGGSDGGQMGVLLFTTFPASLSFVFWLNGICFLRQADMLNCELALIAHRWELQYLPYGCGSWPWLLTVRGDISGDAAHMMGSKTCFHGDCV